MLLIMIIKNIFKIEEAIVYLLLPDIYDKATWL